MTIHAEVRAGLVSASVFKTDGAPRERQHGGFDSHALPLLDLGIMTEPVRILYRPVGPKELALIADAAYREFPPRLPEQPIFYPVTNEEYARHIAEQWNVKESGAGYVTRFAVREAFIAQYPIQQVGARVHTEYWVPADELPELNRNIVGVIEVIASFGPASSRGDIPGPATP